MVKWTEVSAYSGMPVKEDAPTNATGAAVAGTGDDSSVVVMKKKKKKTFLDARTKAYKEHQKRLEAARARREERKKQAAKINEGQLDEREKGIDSLPRQFLNPDKEVISLLDKGDTSTDPSVRKESYKKALSRIADQVFLFPLWSYNTNYAFSKDVDFDPTADEIPRFFTAKWK